MLMLLALLAAASTRALAGTVELDASTLWASVSAHTDVDLLVFFFTPPQQRPTSALISTLSRRMNLTANPSTTLGMYDLALHGWPSGLHVHHAEDGAVILFPAGGREPHAYDWVHDPLSNWPAGQAASVGADGSSSADSAAADAEEGRAEGEDEHHHAHALSPSANGVLRWLKAHSSFPSDIPIVALSDVWEGREDGLFSAVLSGLEALHKRMAALQAENTRLSAELERCASGGRR